MSSRKYSLSDPAFNEFVYNSIATSTPDQRSRLPFDLHQHVTSKARIKKFVDTEPLERKLAMLAYLGIEVSVWLSPPEYMRKDIMLDTAKEFENDRYDQVNRMIRAKSFVFTDREIMSNMIMMAQNCHSETYIYNRDYHQLTNQITSLEEAKPGAADAAKEAMSEFKLLCKYNLHMLMQKDCHVDGFSTIKEIELAILFYLFIHRHDSVEPSAVCDYLYPAFQRTLVSSAILRLRESLYVNRLTATKKIVISGKGIQSIGNYLIRLNNQTFNS